MFWLLSVGCLHVLLFPGWGFIAMGLGILLLSYNFQKAASKETDDFELIKSAKPVLDNSGYQRHLEVNNEAYSQESWEV